ncbi:MAG TPA: hypothetical protein DCE41_34675 [Cytophagales bacterium]|nr:hypothetical protein [Cytophagales bacterium]
MKLGLAVTLLGISATTWAQTPAPRPTQEPVPEPDVRPAPEPVYGTATTTDWGEGQVITIDGNDSWATAYTSSSAEDFFFNYFTGGSPTDPDLQLVTEALEEMMEQRLQGGEQVSSGWGRSATIYGGYNVGASRVEGYGVIFNITESSFRFSNGEVAGIVTDELVSVIQDFLMTYGDLIDGLEPNDKITVLAKETIASTVTANTVRRSGSLMVVSPSSSNAVQLRVSVTKKDLGKLYSGTSQDDFRAKYITVERTEPTEASGNSQISIFANLLKKRFSTRELDRFVALSTPTFEYIPDLGVVFHLRGSNIGRSSVAPVIITTERFVREFSTEVADDLADEVEDELDAANEAYVEQYENFQNQLVEFVVRYGRTLNFLTPNERIIVKVTVPGCTKCDLPDRFDVVVTKDVIDDLAAGKISLEQAAKKVTIN